ncbi:36777_t:CDS:2 [Gigaspora margarita]|uniref:36777_t:CDS:1 n=1 Tax=Gigaspora margarita TaxID=4874 RepID=A0ABN7US18_GIGMA|nr:36777_t:CDS:2 [Gigaspora margarita]
MKLGFYYEATFSLLKIQPIRYSALWKSGSEVTGCTLPVLDYDLYDQSYN